MPLIQRCDWVTQDPLYLEYHDQEWGVPIKDDRLLFEFLILEGMQAGLSWITILKKRAHYREVFDGFDPQLIARYGPDKVASLLQDPGIIRNRLKIQAAISNAKAMLAVSERQSFSDYLWQWVEHQPIKNHWQQLSDVPASTPLSTALSKQLVKDGFKFVGPTIIYAFMQATGMVNDHLTSCYRYGGAI